METSRVVYQLGSCIIRISNEDINAFPTLRGIRMAVIKDSDLLRALFKARISQHQTSTQELLQVVSDAIPNKMCSLWKYNENAGTISICAAVRPEIDITQTSAFVHPFATSLCQLFMDEYKEHNVKCFDVDIQTEPYRELHKWTPVFDHMKLKRLLVFPIPHIDSTDNESACDGILKIYIEDNLIITDSIATIIQDGFSFAFNRERQLIREELTHTILQTYETRQSKDLSSVLHPIVNTVFREYMQYQGCSVFLWNSFRNRLELSQTTGIEGDQRRSGVFYYLGDGITGRIAQRKEPLLIRDLHDMSELSSYDFDDPIDHRWKETLPSRKAIDQSFMGIPIMSPSNPNNLIGVIRFVNRINSMANVIDCFSKEDLYLITYACKQIALYMQFEQSENNRKAFAIQMAHEMFSPTASIRGTADRLKRKCTTLEFSPAEAIFYLDSIEDNAALQIQLLRTVEYMWKGTTDTPRQQRYKVGKYKLHSDVLMCCKKLVIPIAAAEMLKYDNIEIYGQFPTLYIDNFAAEQVFFNLLTNAIKYRQRNAPATFRIRVEGHGLGVYACPGHETTSGRRVMPTKIKGYQVCVSDYGVGIEREEKDKLYLYGYRKKGAEKIDVRGLGLGLYVTKLLLEDFECRIWVSNFHDPTTFNIVFPVTLLSNAYTKTRAWQERGALKNGEPT